jgi:hypothetical protein
MPTTAVTPAASWLNSFDPLNPSSSAAALATPSATDPSTSTTPAGFDILKPSPISAAAGPSTYQQAIDAFKVTADSFLVQSAVNGYTPLAAPAALGSAEAAFQSLGNTIDVLKTASLSGNYGNINALA